MRQGIVVQTGGGRTALVVGHVKRAAVVVPIVRGVPRRRSDVPISGDVLWADIVRAAFGHTYASNPIRWGDPTASRTGYVACAFAYRWPERLLRVVGWASEELMQAVLKAQIRELEARDAPPTPLRAEIAEDFAECQRMAA